jgi:hypothetical protein
LRESWTQGLAVTRDRLSEGLVEWFGSWSGHARIFP